MEKEKKISKEPAGTKLFSKDSEHIKKLIKKYRYTDKRFESSSSAIRYYVELGIAAENSPEYTAENLKNRIVLSSQKNIIGEQLVPLTETIEILFERMKIFDKHQTDYFAKSEQRIDEFESRVAHRINGCFERLTGELQSIGEQLIRAEKTDDETLRNLVVLRIILYVFLLRAKAGEVERRDESILSWIRTVSLAHDHAARLPTEEIKLLNSEVLETYVIREIATKIFKQVASVSEPVTE